MNYGGSQTFVITAATGYAIADVLVDGVSVGALTSYTFSNVTENHSIAASFSLLTYTINATAGDHGFISPEGMIMVNHGGNATFTFTPDENYQVYAFWVDGDSIGNAGFYEFTNVTDNHTIYVEFSLIIGLAEVPEIKVLAYPVPMTENLYLQVENLPFGNDIRYQLVDNQGKCVAKGRIAESLSTIPVGSFASGSYILQIYQKEKMLLSYKLVKF